MPQSPKLRIVIDARYLSKPGMGINLYLESIIDILLSEDYDLTLLLNKPLVSTKKDQNAKIVILPSRFKLYWEQILLPRFLKRTTYDIYFAPSNNGLPLFYKKEGHIFILTIHDLIPFHFPFLYIRKPAFMFSYMLSMPLSVLRANVIVADSKFTANDIRRIFHKHAVPIYVPTGNASKKITPNKANRQENMKFFVFNGGIDPRKNVDQLIEGFQLFNNEWPEYKLIIMGKGHAKYQKIVRQQGINNIEFTGYVSEEKKVQLISKAVALIYPSSMEGFGLPIIEAFYRDTLVITADNSSLSEVAGKGAIYLDQISPAAICSAMTKVVNLTSEERQTYIKEGRKQLQYFSPGKIKDYILKVFEEAMS